MNISTILQIIKEKNEMPPDRFEYLMQAVSQELNDINYSHKSIGGVDFELVDQLMRLRSKNQLLESKLMISETSLEATIHLFNAVQKENSMLKEQLLLLKDRIKIKIINAIKSI